ncbi:3-ketoacyl-CoA synthase 11-like [Argentina anserina]|uniref:3-ketoacyl-CoA synthase 11-like n=1 Tax=Argentina anserina TaxID=57926 RepID=UPI0021766DC3|nr:3-ketoacyl-CoA synthase 11-like [Potentilla anserina]
MKEARKETEALMYGAIDELFARTSVKPKDIGILIVNYHSKLVSNCTKVLTTSALAVLPTKKMTPGISHPPPRLGRRGSRRVLERSGLGDSTYLPEAVFNIPPNPSMKEARKETEALMYGAIDELFARTSVKPKDIGILIVNYHSKLVSNCTKVLTTSALAVLPTKKMTPGISHPPPRLGRRGSRRILERSGLGDSTYLPEAVLNIPPNPSMKEARKETEALMYGAIDELFARTSVKPKDIGILIVNYHSKLVSNCLFRMGGALILLSNKSSDRRRSKYRLVHTVYTHKGVDD